MKRALVTMTLTAIMTAMTIPAALANSENANDSAGAGTTECRPGAEDNELIGGWEPITQEAYTAELIEHFLDSAPDDLTEEQIADIVENQIPASAQATWDFCDKNLDGILCMMVTEPSPYYYTLLDNRPFDPAT